MRVKINLTILLAIFTSLAILYSCKKQSEEAVINISLFKEIVQSYQEQTAVNLSTQNKIPVDSIVAHLDYSSAGKVTTPEKKTLYLIKIDKKESVGYSDYLALYKTDKNDIKLEGIYKMKGIETLRIFLLTKILSPGESITVHRIDGTPVHGWEALKTGKMILKVGEARKTTSHQLSTNNLSTSPKVAYIQNPDPPPCIYWYWVDYDPATGIWYNATLLTTTGCDSAPSGSANCSFTQVEAGGLLNNFTFQNTADVTNSAGADLTDPTTGIIESSNNTEWAFSNVNLNNWGHVQYSAYFTGSRYKNNINDSWKWKTCNYAYSGPTTQMPVCIGLTMSIACAPVISTDESKAGTALDYTGVVSISCLGGIQYGPPRIGHNYTDLLPY